MTHEEIPSLSKYLDEHSADEIVDRLRQGITQILWSGCYGRWSRYRYGYCSQVGLSLIILALSLPTLLFKGIRLRNSYKYIHIVWYVLLFFTLYALSFVWYIPVIGKGPRTFLALVIPLLWTIGLALHSPQIQSLQFTLFQRPIKVFRTVYLLMLLTLFYEIYQLVAFRAAMMDGGN